MRWIVRIVTSGADSCQLKQSAMVVSLNKKKISMRYDLPFNDHAAEYDAWFDRYPYVFETELAAIRKAWPAGDSLMSLEVGSATGRFAKALGVREGIDVAANMCAIAEERGVATWQGIAEDMPYQGQQFDVVLMNCCISYLEDVTRAFKEAYRVIKPGGCLLVGFIDKNSRLGQHYEACRAGSTFYKQASFFSVKEVEEKLREAGFRDFSFLQTLFKQLDEIKSVEVSVPGYGRGSYVLIKAIK